MSRYVGVDALLEYWKPDQGRKFDASYFIYTIECAPSIDLVRCKECKYWKKVTDKDGDSWEVCNNHMIFTGADDFCSYGERRADDE